MFEGLRRKVCHWLIPDYVSYKLISKQVEELYDLISEKGQSVLADGETLKFDRTLILLGSLINCKVEFLPQIEIKELNPTFSFKSMLHAGGSGMTITGSVFHGAPLKTGK
jgi:hypothetical protein